MPPETPKIYHITHMENLPRIVDNVLWSDAERIRRGLNCTIVGMSEIKRHRLEELEVDCHPGTKVGEYVPFYFCPRSIMLFLLYRGNHPDLTYHGADSGRLCISRRICAPSLTGPIRSTAVGPLPMATPV